MSDWYTPENVKPLYAEYGTGFETGPAFWARQLNLAFDKGRQMGRGEVAEHPADDGDAVAVEFLDQCEGATSIDDGIYRFTSPNGIEFFVWANSTVNFGEPERFQRINRGELRAICAALGVELRETKGT